MKLATAFGLGLLSFFLFMFVAETAGALAGFIVLAVYFFVCQFRLSDGKIDAYRTEWPLMLALDATPLLGVSIMLLVEKWSVILSQSAGLLVSACGGTYAGAIAASVSARRAATRY